MFDVCYNCDKKLKEKIGDVYGYWNGVKLKFIKLPKYECEDCGEFYLDPQIAIVTQEITRALNDINKIPGIVDISESYIELIKNTEEIYELIVNKRITLIECNDNIIINKKDIESLFSNKEVKIVARNDNGITKEVEDEINKFCEECDK